MEKIMKKSKKKEKSTKSIKNQQQHSSRNRDFQNGLLDSLIGVLCVLK